MEEELNENPTSGLPPLKKHQQKGSSQSSSPDVLSPNSLKRRLMKIYPNLQKIERDIAGIKQQVPMNLNKTILQLRKQVLRLFEGNKPTFTENDSEKIQKTLNELEERLNKKLKQTLDESSAQIEEKITELEKISPISLEIEAENEISLNYRTSSLEILNAQQEKHFNNKMSNLEQSLSKLTLTNNTSDSTNNVLKHVKETIDSNSSKIELIKSKLDDLQTQFDNQKILLEKTQTQIDERGLGIPEFDTEAKNKNSPPDLTEPLSDLQKRLFEFDSAIATRMDEIDKRGTKCEEMIEQLNQMAVELTESTSELESHSTETEGLCKDLTSAIQRINAQLNKDKNYHLIQSLSMQIASMNESIKTEINTLNQRLSHVELSIPLDYKESDETKPSEPEKKEDKPKTEEGKKEENAGKKEEEEEEYI